MFAIRSLYAIWLEDNPFEKYEIEMSVEVLQSEFELTFGQYRELADAIKGGPTIATDPTIYYYGMKKIDKISDPANIKVRMLRTYSDVAGDILSPTEVVETNEVFKSSYKIHEKSYWHVSAGVGVSYFEPDNFTIKAAN